MGRGRRIAEAICFVAIWIAIGFVLPKDPNVYLLAGVPLTVAFQLFVRRQPIEQAWVRDGEPLKPGTLRAALLLALAIIALLLAAGSRAGGLLWLICAAVGLLGAIYALKRANRETVQLAVRCLVVGGTIGLAIMVVAAVTGGTSTKPVAARLVNGLISAPLYFMVLFVLEEVSFRGVLDTHVQQPKDRGWWPSAVLVSAAWGLWHLPIVDERSLTAVAQLLAVHVPVGVVLSHYWRRSGNLAVPAVTHAAINGVRNALFY